jgi:hypothetical protein
MSVEPGSETARRVLPGYGWWHVHTVRFETGETRLSGLSSGEAEGISRW